MQLSRGTRALRCESGQALVEFALVFPIFMLMLFGLIDVGRLVYTNSAVSQAAREGARLAAAEVAWVGLPATTPGCVVDPSGIDASNPGAHVCPPSTAALEANVLEAVNRMTVGMDQVTTVYLSCNGGDAKTDPAPSGNWTDSSGGNGCILANGSPAGSEGDLVSVRITYEYRALTPIISSLLGPIPLSGSATMVIN